MVLIPYAVVGPRFRIPVRSLALLWFLTRHGAGGREGQFL